MPPLEAWEKVYIGGAAGVAFFENDEHGSIDCVECHDGDDEADDKDDAHEGLRAKPGEQPASVCAECHTQTATMQSSMHGGLWGEKNLLAKRHGVSSYDDLPMVVRQGYEGECGKCHTSCGDCHVARPTSVGGGFIASHRFGSPDMGNQCTACHGSRVGAEYRGQNEGFGADVHYVPGGMRCTACHTATEMHGDGTQYEHRLDVPGPMCEDCHTDDAEANNYHTRHWGDLQCQVCHSQDYKSCNSCHTGGGGLQQPSYMSFKIGLNPVPGKRSYEYVLLRHIPIDPDTYAEFGTPDLAGYESEPTWKYAAPHNNRRWTDRTEVPEGGSCSTACHRTSDGVDGFFLRQADLDAMSPREADANRHLITPDGSPTDW